jgi:hypothetical protein
LSSDLKENEIDVTPLGKQCYFSQSNEKAGHKKKGIQVLEERQV